MIPKFELNDVHLAGQRRDLVQAVGDDHLRPGGFNPVDEATIPWRLEQNENLLNGLGQDRTDGCMRLANPAAEMRRNVQNFHSAATAVNLRLVPPGGPIAGSRGTNALNLSSKTSR